MRLEAFRVRNYKRIEDTGWVGVRDLTVLVGKNESGKSAVLRGLSKLRPSDGEGYDGLREFPRRRYSDEYDEDAVGASGRFSLNSADREALAEITPLLADVESVVISRKYNNRYVVGFDPATGGDHLEKAEVREAVQTALDAVEDSVAPDGRGEEYAPIKTTIISELQTQLSGALAGGGLLTADAVGIASKIISGRVSEQWHKDAFGTLGAPLTALHRYAQQRAAVQTGRNWVCENIPQFIYFDRYDVLDRAINIPTFIQQLRSEPRAPRVRTTKCLFDHVALDPAVLAELISDPNLGEEEMRRRIDERAILASSAGQAMTRRFTEWWLQRRHAFRYDLDGNYFRVWVSDDLDPSEIELDQRSQGMQYFFSFFLVFLVEAQGEHENSILLLDEPGNSLHGTAQAKIIEFLRSISSKNQVIYSTHSPFMIDGEHLEEIRPVWEDPNTGSTNVSDDVWPKDKDALFPLQAALGYNLIQSLFISRHQVLVEGITDFSLTKALDAALRANSREGLDPDIILTPAGGAGRMVPLASMLVGHEVQVVALLDGDESGRKEAKKLERVLGFENRVIFIGDHTHDGNTTGEIEDLFPDDYYLKAAKTASGSKNLRFNADEKAIPNIVDRLEALFTRRGYGDFEKWRVDQALTEQIMADLASVPIETLDSAAAIVEKLNAITK